MKTEYGLYFPYTDKENKKTFPNKNKNTLLFMTIQLKTTFRTSHMPDIVIITENINTVQQMLTFSKRTQKVAESTKGH